jgi:hypothetical protein
VSEMREHLEATRDAWIKFGQPMPLLDFLLEHGQDYAIGPETYAGPRGEAKACYMNATHLALGKDLTYVEGKITVCGIAIEHAWCVNGDGLVVDPTLTTGSDGTYNGVGNYFGIPFQADYVRKACLKNKVYGLLDGFGSRKTLPKLVELGLEDGQRWLIGKKKTARRRSFSLGRVVT